MKNTKLAELAYKEMDKLLQFAVDNYLDPFITDSEVRGNDLFVIEFTEYQWSLTYSINLAISFVEKKIPGFQCVAIQTKVYVFPKERLLELYNHIYPQ